MKTIVTIIMLCGVLGGYAQTTPRYAASTRTWTVGHLIWSDAIRIPECNKSSFADSYTDPQCRSYTQDGNTRYYYNWPYVNKHAATLCPAPWYVPNYYTFCMTLKMLLGITDCSEDAAASPAAADVLTQSWGGEFCGEAWGDDVLELGSFGSYWSSDQDDALEVSAWGFTVARGGGFYPVTLQSSHVGCAIRCVLNAK